MLYILSNLFGRNILNLFIKRQLPTQWLEEVSVIGNSIIIYYIKPNNKFHHETTQKDFGELMSFNGNNFLHLLGHNL